MSEDTNNLPAVPLENLVQTPITPGATTSEGKMAAAAQTVLTVLTSVSAVAATVSTTIPALSGNKWGTILAYIVTGCGFLTKTLISLGYTTSRTAVKTSPYTGSLVAKGLLPLAILALGCMSMSGCAWVKTLKAPTVPKIQVSSAIYKSEVRPLVTIAEAACAAKITPTQGEIINNALLALDQQAATSSTVDIMPVLLTVAATEIGDKIGSKVTLTPAEQAGAQLGLALLAQQTDPTIKALLPVLQNTLSSATVAAPSPPAPAAGAAPSGTVRIGL